MLARRSVARVVLASVAPCAHHHPFSTDAAATARNPGGDAKDSFDSANTAEVKYGRTQNTLLGVGIGLATALATCTVFCFSNDPQVGAGAADGDRYRQQQERAQQLTKNFSGRYSIVGHTDTAAQQHSQRSTTGSDTEARRIDAAGKVGEGGSGPWGGEAVNVSVHDRDQPRSPAAAATKNSQQPITDDELNVAMHEQEIHFPGTQDTLERTDRLDAEAATPPHWITDKPSAFLQGFRLTSREHGNEESNSAASPDEEKRDISHITSEPNERVYAKREDITKADKLSLDGGAKASRDGQAMSDYAKRISSLP